MTLPNTQKHVVPTAVLTKFKLVPITTAGSVTAAALKPLVTRPRQAKTVVTKTYLLPRRHINRSLSPKVINFPPKVTAAKAPMVNAIKGVQGKCEWKPKCTILEHVSRNTSTSMTLKRFDYNDALGRSKHMTWNMSYLSDFEAINRGYVAFGGNSKGELKFNLFSVSQMCEKKNNVLFTDTECLVLSLEFKLPDENQVLLRVPRENNMYNVDLKNIVPFMDLTCLFAKATLDESNLWHRRPGHINFKTLNKLVKDAAFEEKEPEFEGRKPESEVYVSSSSSSQSKKHDDKTKRKAKGKSPVKSLTGYRNLSAEFEDFSDNSINKVNAADSLVPAVGQIFTNNTNTFSAAGPSDIAVSLTHGKSLYVDSSQLPDDPNMPKLEDITYSDDEEDVGAEANFTNLETTITVSPIPTTRVHKDHLVTQIIGYLSSATQKRSMTWVAKDQGGLSQINNDDFHTCMFTCFLSQEEPKREEGIDYEEVFAPVVRIEAIRLFLAYASFMGFMVYQVDVKSAFLYETIEEKVYVCQPLGFKDPDYPDKRGKIDQTLFIKRQKGDILLVQIYVDDIIFGFTNKDLCKAFENVMKDKFQMSSMGELTFFLGLQVKQKKDEIFICQDKYVAEILRKFGLTDGRSASTPIDTEKPLLKDP
nr:copia protein [Tanacetum cinerariifolium]